jgi:hypothetical protein
MRRCDKVIEKTASFPLFFGELSANLKCKPISRRKRSLPMSAPQIRQPYKVNMMTLGIALLLAGATASGLIENRIAHAAGAGKDFHLLSEAEASPAPKDKG